MVTLRGTDTQPWVGPFATCLEPEENPDADHVHIALTDVPTIDISIALQLALDYRSIGISRSITTRFMTTWYYGPGGMILSGGA